MRHRQLGNTGLAVAPLGVGTLTWGRDTPLAEAEDIWRTYRAAGGNLIDTSPTYGEGMAEGVVGEVIAGDARDDIVVITKGGYVPRESGSRFSASKNAILGSIDRSLEALQTDYIDVFLLQRPDTRTPLAETLSTFDMALRSGRVRYIGIANHSAWDTAQVYYTAKAMGIPLAMVSAEYSLLQRGVERELLPGLESEGIGFVAWSALARGVLTAKYRHSTPPDSRAASPILSGFVEPYMTEKHAGIVEAVYATAKGLDVSPLTVATAWLTIQQRVSSALIGPRTALQMKQIAEGADFALPQQLVDALNDVSAIELGYPELNSRRQSI